MSIDPHRRQWLKSAGATLILMPLLFTARAAGANINAALRAQFKYRNTPQQNMSCTSCLEFIPGKTEQDSGGCKIIPGDDEVSPNGYCTRWNTM